MPNPAASQANRLAVEERHMNHQSKFVPPSPYMEITTLPYTATPVSVASIHGYGLTIRDVGVHCIYLMASGIRMGMG